MADVQYVIFRLEDEYYGAEIQNIQEVILPKLQQRFQITLTSLKGL